MQVPQGFIELVLTAICVFVTKTLVGLISKNEVKSDEADIRIEIEIKELRTEIKEIEQRFRMNDREIYAKIETITGKISNVLAQIECMKGKA